MDRSMLMARDPILFWDEIPLYESELDDNGVSQLRVKASVSYYTASVHYRWVSTVSFVHAFAAIMVQMMTQA